MKSETKKVLLISLLASIVILLIACGVRTYLNQFPEVPPVGISAIPATDAGKRALLNSFNTPATAASPDETSVIEEKQKSQLDVFVPADSSTTHEKSDEEKLRKLNELMQ